MSRSAASENGFSDVNTDKSLNTAGHVRAWADELLVTASRFRKELYALEGHVLSERIDYEDKLRVRESKLPQRAPKQQRGQAIFELSIPIENLPALLDWLRMNSIIVEQYVVATRDTGMPSPEVAATQNQRRAELEQRLAELEQRMAQASEQERVALEAEHQALLETLQQMQIAASSAEPEVRLARLDVRFETDRPQARFAAAWIVPSLRTSLLVSDVLEQRGARETRVGAAIGVGLATTDPGGLIPAPLVELAGYPSTADQSAGVTVTLGAAVYARSLGEGERMWLNPFAGLRLGYAYLDAHAFAAAGELGLEILKTSGVAWSASMRPYGLVGKESQVALETGTSLSIAF